MLFVLFPILMIYWCKFPKDMRKYKMFAPLKHTKANRKVQGADSMCLPPRSYGEHALLSDTEIEVHAIHFAAGEKEAAESEIVEVGADVVTYRL